MSSVKDKLRYFLETPKISLNNVQNWMQEMILKGNEEVENNPHQFLHKGLSNSDIESVIKPSKKMSAADRLAIYQRSYLARLRDCMSSQFSALEYALGKELFQMFTDQYLQSYPSHSYTLIDLGKDFAQFLDETRPDKDYKEKESWPDFLIELVSFEYAISIIFDEKANEEFQIATTVNKEEELKLIPVFYLFEHRFPVSLYYKDFLHEKKPELPFPDKNFCIVLRNNYKLGLFEIPEEQFHFLNYLKESETISIAKEHFMIQHNINKEAFKKVWPKWKKRWIESGFLCIK